MLSKYTAPNIIGTDIRIAAVKNEQNRPSLNTLMNRRGTQPIGDVFLIINAIVRSAVKQTVSKLNCFFNFK